MLSWQTTCCRVLVGAERRERLQTATTIVRTVDVMSPHAAAVGPSGMHLEEIYAATAGRLVAQLYGFTGDFAEAQDVVQEAFARALARPSRLRDVDDPEAWLRTVAFNLARSRHRRRVFFDRLSRSGRIAGPTETPAISPDHVALVAALQRLPRTIREAVVLHHIADLPVADVAGALGCSVDAVKTRLVRGRRALALDLGRDAISEEGPATGTGAGSRTRSIPVPAAPPQADQMATDVGNTDGPATGVSGTGGSTTDVATAKELDNA